MSDPLAVLDQPALSQMQTLVATAQQGAFYFYAIVFVLITTTASQIAYSKICARLNPPASVDECQTYKTYFKVNMWFGIALVVASVIWFTCVWTFERSDRIAHDGLVTENARLKSLAVYRYQFTILNTRSDLAQVSTDYFRLNSGSSLDPRVRLDVFVVESPQPFSSNMSFEVTVSLPDAQYLACVMTAGSTVTCPAAESVVQQKLKVPFKDPAGQFLLKVDTKRGTASLDPA